MKISTATVFGLVVGGLAGFLGLGTVSVPYGSQAVSIVQRYAWWIVVVSMLFPFVDYLSGMRTTVTGVLTRHPYRRLAGFFAGLAVGLGLFLLLAPKLL